MISTVVVLASGDHSRFGPDPKQLSVVAGETIIGRLLRMVFHRIKDPHRVVVVTHDNDIAVEAMRYHVWVPLIPADRRYTLSSLVSSSFLWHGRVACLLGDVIYSPDTLDRIFSHNATLAVWGNTAEIYALSWGSGGGLYRSVIERAKSAYKIGGKLRHFYQDLCGCEWEPEVKKMVDYWARGVDMPWPDNVVFQYVGDWTRDVDTPEDLERARIEMEGKVIQKGFPL